jgi:hypothetical protein
MAELLVMAHDKASADPYLDCRCYKRGDVVVVRPDGWAWGREELLSPLFRIVRVPVSVSEAEAFLARERDTDPTRPSRTLQRRWFRFAVDAAPEAFRTWWREEARRRPMFDLSGAPAQEIRALKSQKQTIEDPAVIG